MAPNRPPELMHGDAGLQLERTTLAWGRTMMALVTVSTIFLCWLPHHGLPILALFNSGCNCRRCHLPHAAPRYSTSSYGIQQEKVNAEIVAVLWTAFAGAVLGILGIAVVLAS